MNVYIQGVVRQSRAGATGLGCTLHLDVLIRQTNTMLETSMLCYSEKQAPTSTTLLVPQANISLSEN